MYYQKVGLKNWEYKPDKYPNIQDKMPYIQNFAIYDIGFIQTPEQLGVAYPYPNEYVDSLGYVWYKREGSVSNKMNQQFSPNGSRGLVDIDHADYTFRMLPWMEGRLDAINPPDLGTLNGPVFYPNYFHNVRG
jgi:hypothetical protein